jgi:hypothetical protein
MMTLFIGGHWDGRHVELSAQCIHGRFAVSVDCEPAVSEQLPITQEWLLSIGFKRIQGTNEYRVDGLVMILCEGECWTSALRDNLKSRRDVRVLCELLQIKLKQPD